MVESKAPQTFADERLILGDQGAGKTCSAVAFIKDDYYKQLNGIKSPSGETIKASILSQKDKDYLTDCKIFPDVFKYVRVFLDDGTKSKIIRIPQDYLVVSPVKIFSTIHLYGLRYKFITIADVIQFINSDLFIDAWILSDESAMTSARNSMTAVGKLMAGLGAQVRKMDVHFCQTAQYYRMVDWEFKAFATMTVLCSYDEKTRMITLDVKERGKNPWSRSYWAPAYWKNFKTKERAKVPEKTLARAYQTVA